MSHEFRPGEVISCPYLWAWQQQRGETEGRKPRPVCIVIAIRSARDGNTHLVLLAITTQPPQAGRIALEIPDIVEHSWYIEPHQAVLGRFSKSFVMKIAALFAKVRSQSGQVKRFD